MPALLIADDHPLFRAALTQAARLAAPEHRILEAETLDQAVAALECGEEVELVLLDLHMPGNHGLSGLAALRAQFPDVAVAVCSGHDEARIVRRALAHGASGFIPKRSGMDDIRRAITALLGCETWLPEDLKQTLARTAEDPKDSALAKRLSSLTAQQFRVLDLLALAFICGAGYIVWALLMKNNPVSRIAIFGFVNPVVNVLLSALINGEPLFRWQYLGALVLVCIGIWLVNKAPAKKERAR